MRFLIPDDWQVPTLFIKRLGDSIGRQRAMTADGHLLLVLHELPIVGVPERTGRLFWRDPQGAWRSKGLGEGVQSLKRHIAEFADQVDDLEKRWHSAASADDYYVLLRAIAPLHRTTHNLHTTLQQARELVPEDRDLINLRDQIGEIERAVELLHGDVKNGLDFTVANQLEKQTERTYHMAVSAHRLNLMAATFFPIATLSTIYGAIFGMIVAHKENEAHEWSTPSLFWSVLGIGLVLGFVLARTIAQRPEPITTPDAKDKTKRR